MEQRRVGGLWLLRRLLRLRRAHAEELNDEGLHMLDRCIATALFDSIDAGAADAARASVRYYQRPREANRIEDSTPEPLT